MKKKVKLLAVVFVVVVQCALALFGAGCAPAREAQRFGEFGYNGHYLTQYAIESISASDAKSLVGNRVRAMSDVSAYAVTDANMDEKLPDSELVNSIMSKYTAKVTTKYYQEGVEDQLTKTDEYMGEDFRSILSKNKIEPFGQLIAKGVLIYGDLIDYMEAQNAAFKASANSAIAPFREVFTYHKDVMGNIVIQTKNFTALPSSVGGGIGCSFRQDTEIVYDGENKMIKWQTSLGISSATPDGTMKQGYILEVEIEWIEKD